MQTTREIFLPVCDYDLSATLTSGQAFRWFMRDGGWEGVIGSHWVRLRQRHDGLLAETVSATGSSPDAIGTGSSWLRHYLQTDTDIGSVLLTFPQDEAMRGAVAACRGLRLLRQEPWECLASFILSSTKQIVQIQQIVAALCLRFGEPLAVPPGHEPVFGFPCARRLARATEAELRECKMGFRAPNLLNAARMVSDRELDLEAIRHLSPAKGRDQLMRVRGVGEKIANCVLLFAYGFQEAFPVDVWVKKALRELYFPKRRPTPQRLERFIATYFGPNAGYAQQYLFHYMRTRSRRLPVTAALVRT